MITLATAADLPQILAIYAHARAFMAQHGNPNQWGASPPNGSGHYRAHRRA